MQDYASQVAAEVAARYGVQVMPDAVQIIPRGVSSHPGYVFRGNSLVPIVDEGPSTAMKRLINGSWKEAARKRRVMAAKAREAGKQKERKPRDTSAMQAAAEARRAQVADMAAKGATIKQIAGYFGILEKSAAKYCRDNGITVMRGAKVNGPKVKAADRRRSVMEFAGAGDKTSAEIAAFLGVSLNTAYNYIKRQGIPFIRAVDARVPAPRVVKERGPRAPSKKDLASQREAERKAAMAERRQRVAALFREGASAREIAEKLGLTEGAVDRDIHVMKLRRSDLPEGKSARARYMAERRKVATERANRVLELRSQGMTAKQISEAIGCSIQSVQRDFRLLGIQHGKPGPRGIGAKPELVRQAKALRARKMSFRDIEKALNIPKSTLVRALRPEAA